MQASGKALHKLAHLNIQVSVPRPIPVMQHVWRISKNILFSELPPYHPFPLHSSLPEREREGKKLLSPVTAKWGSVFRPTLIQVLPEQHINTLTTHIYTHTHISNKAESPWGIQRKLLVNEVCYNNLLLSGKLRGNERTVM